MRSLSRRSASLLVSSLLLVAACDSDSEQPGSGAAASGAGTATGGAAAGGATTGGNGTGGAAGGSGGGQVGGTGGTAGSAGVDPCIDGPLVGLPYPHRAPIDMKGIQPDFWPNQQELVDHHTGTVAMNLVWAHWEPQVKTPPCSGAEQEYSGRCYVISSAVDDAIADWTSRGVEVTAVLYGVPPWARTGNPNCSPIAQGFEIFCTPDDANEYGRFVGMVASRYDGLKGHGRVADFVIHNEVNANAWFDIGCGQGTPCDTNTWIQTYADNYNAAYDEIKQHQSAARVLYSFEHHFDTVYDQPSDTNAMLSVKTFITQLDGLVGNRRWQVAYHPYAPSLLSAEFSPLDLPRVTYGNLGVLLGWLRTTFPNDACAWTVQLTESGINSGPPSSEAAQGPAVCDSLRNVLATPGITNYLYHRMQDVASEAPLVLGLHRENGSAKPAWEVWAWANHTGPGHPSLSCGFEHLPYTRLASSHGGWANFHWASSRLAPPGFVEDGAWYLLRAEEPGTELLFECFVPDAGAGVNAFSSTDPLCAGATAMGPVGYLWTSQVTDTVPLYHCTRTVAVWTDAFVSADANCEGNGNGTLLGYVRPIP